MSCYKVQHSGAVALTRLVVVALMVLSCQPREGAPAPQPVAPTASVVQESPESLTDTGAPVDAELVEELDAAVEVEEDLKAVKTQRFGPTMPPECADLILAFERVTADCSNRCEVDEDCKAHHLVPFANMSKARPVETADALQAIADDFYERRCPYVEVTMPGRRHFPVCEQGQCELRYDRLRK